MLKKLTEEKQEEILQAGISEFAEKGLAGASMNGIACRAGISVGVLYKYYENKEDFFRACVRSGAEDIHRYLQGIMESVSKPLPLAKQVILSLREYARKHPDTLRLYFEVTSMEKIAEETVSALEAETAEVYTEYIRNAQEKGVIRQDMDPNMLAFFFDNLLMMLQFTYTCPYYTERANAFLGEDAVSNDEHMIEQLLRFAESAFTLDSRQIVHSSEED